MTITHGGGAMDMMAMEAAPTASASTSLFDYAMASTYNTAGTSALVTSADVGEEAEAEAGAATEAATASAEPTTSASATTTTLFSQAIEPADLLSDKKTGRPSHPAWEHFDRGPKRNRFHHNAYCKYCAANGAQPQAIRGVSGNMIRHLQKCVYCPEEIVAQLKAVCAQKDALNFNKRHQTQPSDVDVQAMVAETAAKKLKRSHSSSVNEVDASTAAPNAHAEDDFIPLPLQLEGGYAPPGRAAALSRQLAAAKGEEREASLAKRNGDLQALVKQLQPHGLARGSSSPVDPAVNPHYFLKATVSSDLPMDWIAMEQSTRVLGSMQSNFVVPAVSLVYDTTTAASVSAAAHDKQLLRVKEESTGVSLAINSWYSKLDRTNLMLLSLVNALGEASAWKLIDLGADEVVLDDLSSQIKEAVTSLYEDGVNLMAIVADSLSVYAAAKAMINDSDYPHGPIQIFPSFEAFLINALGVILTVCDTHISTMGRVIEMVRTFNNKHVLEYLRRECGDPDAVLVLPSRERWYSFIECIDSVRQFEDMIKIIATRVVLAIARAKNGEERDVASTSADDVIGTMVPASVLESIQNPQFWETIVSLSELMSPLKETYRVMTGSSASSNSTVFSLADVFYQLGRMHQQYTAIITDWEENPSSARAVNHVRYLQEQVNKIWKLYDQSLLVLAYTLDYNMTHPQLSRSHAALQWLSIGKHAKEHFRNWFCGAGVSARAGARSPLSEDTATQFLEDILAYKERKHPFDPDTMCEFENPRAFYHLISDSNPLMSMFGSRLFSFATSAPSLAGIIPNKSCITRAAATTMSQDMMFLLLQVKLYSRTNVRTSRELQTIAQGGRVNARKSSVSSKVPHGVDSGDSSTASLQSGVDKRATTGIWSEREWRVVANAWKLEWEHEGSVGNILDTVAGLTSTPSSRLTSLDQIFKEKLVSRLQQGREEAVVDV
ncbi:hypothetical protein Poli38472_002546 [Pythium oligandrum]|uniref:BED-type domain-containing protein n=1 Tax=Pythium oligandrum TaxID=41045 RepID=A0A8K1CJ13_PYTOL|nr:hypothetical protein Poli38472_002546 [Pythium oligandrum]|eukprot:TMW63605.1 hypothetical protein Poli38472_002546 [Pythium oligandrum]